MAKSLVIFVGGVALGLLLAWLATQIGLWVIWVVFGIALAWAIREIRWARRLLRQLRDDDDDE